jgi:hypothetical protein
MLNQQELAGAQGMQKREGRRARMRAASWRCQKACSRQAHKAHSCWSHRGSAGARCACLSRRIIVDDLQQTKKMVTSYMDNQFKLMSMPNSHELSKHIDG